MVLKPALRAFDSSLLLGNFFGTGAGAQALQCCFNFLDFGLLACDLTHEIGYIEFGDFSATLYRVTFTAMHEFHESRHRRVDFNASSRTDFEIAVGDVLRWNSEH